MRSLRTPGGGLQIAAASCVLGKIGYGSVSECLAHAKPLIFVRRDFFNEEPFLRKQLEIHGLDVEIQRRDFLRGNWRAFIQHAASLSGTYRWNISEKQHASSDNGMLSTLPELGFDTSFYGKKKLLARSLQEATFFLT